MTKAKIGFFDSGIGGISVMAYARYLLPMEDFIYYADTKHVPYGTKTREQIIDYSIRAVDYLIDRGASIVVVACNTATSMAIETLRKRYSIPIVGMEPAVKPASLTYRGDNILICATPVTIAGEKLHALIERSFSRHLGSAPTLVALPGLVEFAEKGDFDSKTIDSYLSSVLDLSKKYDAVVLGCTHFTYFSSSFRRLLGDVDLIDGTRGTVNQMIRLLREHGFTPKTEGIGSVEYIRSGEVVTDKSVISFFDELSSRALDLL